MGHLRVTQGSAMMTVLAPVDDPRRSPPPMALQIAQRAVAGASAPRLVRVPSGKGTPYSLPATPRARDTVGTQPISKSCGVDR